jgi:hypothetical protein
MPYRMKRILEFPADILSLIRAFSRPIGLRLDWRTCKRRESRKIRQSNLALLLWYKWFLGKGTLYPEVNSWTFHGRRHLLYVSRRRFWTHLQGEPNEEDREWYEKRFMLKIHPIPHSPFPIEVHMSHVSLVV